jgi:probable addiction module antidote protein/putative addiction module killer protein
MYVVFQTEEFVAWLDDLKVQRARVRIAARLRYTEAGNLGDWQPIDGEASEMRIHDGPGYRLYFVRRGRIVIVMLNAGDKSTRQRHPPRSGARRRGWRGPMTKARAPLKLVPFDAAKYLNDDEAIAEYMTAVLETEDPDLLLLALGDVARAKGMAQVARDAGLGRESLYKALAPGAKPRFETVMRVAKALGVRFTARAV